MISAFTGWNDAAGSATAALEFLGGQFGVERAGTIDPDEFFDFQVTRPTVTLTEGQTRQIDWPEVTISTGRAEGADRDVVGEDRRADGVVDGAEVGFRFLRVADRVVHRGHDDRVCAEVDHFPGFFDDSVRGLFVRADNQRHARCASSSIFGGDGADDQFALGVAEVGDLARGSQDEEPGHAAVEKVPREVLQRIRVDAAVSVAGGDNRGNDALELGRHR